MSYSPAIRMLTVIDVAATLRVGLRTVERWIEERELATFQKGDARVSEEELTKFVLLNTLKAKRPDWLTAELQSEFERRLEEIVSRRVHVAFVQYMRSREMGKVAA